MRTLSVAVVMLFSALAAREPVPDPLEVSTGAELEQALSGPRHDAVIVLAPGVYELTPKAAVDSTCGNCANPDTLIPITVGLSISGRNVRIEGPLEGTATIVTRAGYGLYFKDCADCEIDGIVVTGGTSDTSSASWVATRAGIVVIRSSVTIRNCVIADNVRSASEIAKAAAGVGGICAREGADLAIGFCEIIRNSGDGISLFRDARAIVTNTLIDGDNADGVEAYGAPRTVHLPGLGLGIAISLHHNAEATVERSVLRRCLGGIRIFHDASMVARGNIIEGTLWGVNVWSGASGTPRLLIERNAIYDCKTVGISVYVKPDYVGGEEPGRISENIIVHTRQDPRLDHASIYHQLIPEGLSIRGNVYYDNRDVGEDPFGKNTTKEMFWRERRGWVRTFRNTGVGVNGRVKFYDSAFLIEYPRWWN